MQNEVAALRKQVEQLSTQLQEVTALLHETTSHLAASRAENKFLKQKMQLLLKRMFGKKSEKLSPDQLELLLSLEDPAAIEESEEEPETTVSALPRRGGSRERRPRIPENLPVEDVVIDPEEVKQQPENYRLIGQEVTEELDVEPTRYFRRRIIRRKYVSKLDRSLPPVMAPALPRLIEGGFASVGLLADIMINKYVDHLPLCRQEQILRRYGIDLSRKTMCDWVGDVAGWFKPIYELIRDSLSQTGYLQVDETPIRYVRAEGGGSAQGYLWVFHHPPWQDVLYEWHTGRGADCLKTTLDDFRGTMQCDGYVAYDSYARRHPGIELAGCWAHARRKFHEAQEESPDLAGWFLHQIGQLYRIETRLRETKAGTHLRQAVRAAESAMILTRIQTAIKRKLSHHLPRSLMGQALAYTLSQWDKLIRYRDDGQVLIDNNKVENLIRPTAVGKKNWLFIGHPEAGERSAILYTILESCKRRGIPLREYLCDVLTRLPTMKITEVAQLTPANWQKARQAQAA